MSDSVRPHRRQLTRLPRPWDSPGKNTGVGCHFCLGRAIKSHSRIRPGLHCQFSSVAQSCPTFSQCCCCCCYVTSVVSDSVRSHRWQLTRLPRPWDSPGKNTGVGCHFLLQCMKVKSESEVSQLCLTLRDPMDCSPPGSSVHGSFQARVLEWGAIAFSEA